MSVASGRWWAKLGVYAAEIEFVAVSCGPSMAKSTRSLAAWLLAGVNIAHCLCVACPVTGVRVREQRPPFVLLTCCAATYI